MEMSEWNGMEWNGNGMDTHTNLVVETRPSGVSASELAARADIAKQIRVQAKGACDRPFARAHRPRDRTGHRVA